MIALIQVGVIGFLFSLVFAPFALAFMIFWIWMLVHAITNRGLRDMEKLIWVVVILFAPFLGAVIYFFVGRPRQSQPITP